MRCQGACIRPAILASILVFFSPVALSAKSGGIVDAMQMPAWIDRDGVTQPLKPGMALKSGDVVSTGPTSKLLLRLEEGSYVKLGENAQLDLSSLQPPEEEQGFFEAVLKVVKGAFRFTTSALSQTHRRNVSVKIGTITAGIRGTDIWGSSGADKDVLCLIEGKITAQREGEPEFDMADPLSFYVVPKDQPALPVQPVTKEQLAQWAAETELLSGGGVLTIEGRWAVNLMSLNSEAATRPVTETLSNAGYATDVEQVKIKEKSYFRIRVSGFKTREDAKTFADTIEGLFEIRQPWVVRF